MNKKTFTIYLYITGEFDNSYALITAYSCKKTGETKVIVNDDVEIDFQNEILGIAESQNGHFISIG